MFFGDPRVCVSTTMTTGEGLSGMMTMRVQQHVPVVMGCGQCRDVQRLCKMCGQRLNERGEAIEPKRAYMVWIGGDMKQTAQDGFLWMTPFGYRRRSA